MPQPFKKEPNLKDFYDEDIHSAFIFTTCFSVGYSSIAGCEGLYVCKI
jgi:hypothetical protein